MKNIITLIGVLSILIMLGCSKQKGEICYTYEKAIGAYGDLESIRSQPLNSASQSIENITKVFYGDDFILIGEKEKGIHIINSSNNKSLIRQSFINIPYIGEFYVKGHYLYAESLYDLLKIDISDPYNCNLIKRNNNAIRTPFINTEGKALIGFNYITVSECFDIGSDKEIELRKNNKLFFDFNSELIPESVIPHTFLGAGRKIGAANKMAYKNSCLYILNRTSILTFTDGASGLSLVNTFKLIKNNDRAELETAYLEGNNLFVGSNIASYIVDVSNPIRPILAGEYNRIDAVENAKDEIEEPNNTADLTSDLTGEILNMFLTDPILPNGDVAYITLHGQTNVLQIIDITNYSSIDVLSVLEMEKPLGLTLLNENTLLIGEGENGISLVNISDPSMPYVTIHNNNIESYDVISHPTKEGEFLSVNNLSITLYKHNTASNSIEYLSEISLP